MRRVILAANPSHGTDIEHRFWSEVRVAAVAKQWELVEVFARPKRLEAGGPTLYVPPRLIDCARILPPAKDTDLPWAPRGSVDLLTQWEHRRWTLPIYRDDVRAGCQALAQWHESLIADVAPAVIWTTNKIDHGVAFPRWLAMATGTLAGLVERSPMDSIWFEPNGIFGESEIWARYEQVKDNPDPEWERAGTSVVRQIALNPQGFRAGEGGAHSLPSDLDAAQRPLVFLPMDNVLWTGLAQAQHPQRRIDHPYFSETIDALQTVSREVDAIGGSLIVKPHPSCREINVGLVPNTTIFCDADLASLIQVSDAVVCLNTKVAFPAVAMNKPTVVLAHNPIAASGACWHARTKDEIGPMLRNALSIGMDHERFRKFRQFCGWLDAEFFVKDGRELANRTIELAEAAFSANLHPFEISDLSHARHRLTGKGEYRSVTISDSPHTPRADARLTVAFDIDRLLNDELHHSGISRYARAVIREMTARGAMRVIPFTQFGLDPDLPENTEIVQLFGSNCPPEAFEAVTEANAEAWRAAYTPDLYHSPHGPLPPRALLGGAVRILTVHDVLHLKFPSLYPHLGEDSMIRLVLESVDVDSDFIMADSEATRRDLLAILPIDEERVSVVPLAAEAGFYSPDVKTANSELEKLGVAPGSYLACLCQGDPRKNIPRLIEALGLVQRSGKADALQFVLIGNANFLGELRSMVESAGLDWSRTHLLSGINDALLAGLYAQARLSVFVPLYEGFGLPPLEAMAAGCPIVVSASSSLMEVVGDAGFYVNPIEVSTIADGILALAQNDSLHHHLSLAAQKRAAQFSWDATAKQVERGYRHALNRQDLNPLPMTNATVRQVDPTTGPAPAFQKTSRETLMSKQLNRLKLILRWYTTPEGLATLVFLTAMSWFVLGLPLKWLIGLAAVGLLGLGVPAIAIRARNRREEDNGRILNRARTEIANIAASSSRRRRHGIENKYIEEEIIDG